MRRPLPMHRDKWILRCLSRAWDKAAKEVKMDKSNSAATCKDCAKRYTEGMFGMEPCPVYEEMGDIPACLRFAAKEEEDIYTPSATAGDYSPSCPWNAPGMSVRDFI